MENNLTLAEAQDLHNALVLAAYQHLVKTGKIKLSIGSAEAQSVDHLSSTTIVSVLKMVCAVTNFVCPFVNGM